MALTVGAQSNEFDDIEAMQPSSPPSTAPVENEAPSPSVPAESTSSQGTTAEVPLPSRQQQTLISSATVVGMGIKNAQGETIGDIQEIMIDPETGKVTYAMVTDNGQWGMGKQKSFAVPWEALKVAFNQTT
jgi:sporulation protein YlmC with PRC-barrel domain